MMRPAHLIGLLEEQRFLQRDELCATIWRGLEAIEVYARGNLTAGLIATVPGHVVEACPLGFICQFGDTLAEHIVDAQVHTRCFRQ